MNAIREIHPRPDEAKFMPYAPAVRVQAGSDMLFISGATASPLYHRHPHVAEEHVHVDDIREQTRRAMDNIKIVLDAQGLTWRHVVKVIKYCTDPREFDDVNAVMSGYFGDWRPASTLLAVHALSSPGARVELEMVAVAPPRG